MALERVPADIRAQGGVSRMSDPDMIDGIISGVSIPVHGQGVVSGTSSRRRSCSPSASTT